MQIYKNVLILAIILLGISNAISQSASEQLSRARRLKQNGVLIESVSVYESYLKKVPSDIEARIELVQVLLQLNRTPRAISHIDDLSWRKPNDPEVKAFKEKVKEFRQEKQKSVTEIYEKKINDKTATSDELLQFARYLASEKRFSESINVYHKYLAKKPNDSKVRLELAKQHAWKKQYKESNKQIDILLKENPKNTDALMLRGDLFLWQDKRNEALSIYQRVTVISPKHKGATASIRKITSSPGFKESRLLYAVEKDSTGPSLLNLAKYYKELGRIFEAEELVDKRLAAAPTDEKALEMKLEFEEIKHNHIMKMIEKYQQDIAANPADTTALLSLARYYTAEERYEEAIDAYNMYISRFPNDYEIRMDRAYIYTWTGKTIEAEKEFRTIGYVEKYKQEADIGLADALLIGDQNLNEVEEIYRKQLVDNPEDSHCQVGLAETLRRQGYNEEARELFEAVLKKEPENKEAQKGLELLSTDISPRIRFLEKEIENDPDNPKLHRRLASYYFSTERYFEAEGHVIWVLEKNPEDERMKSMLERIKTQKRLYMKEEAQRLKLLVEENPYDDELRLEYADLLLHMDKKEEALSHYKMVVEKRPGDAKVNMKLAEIYLESQMWDEAIEIYARLADENPQVFEFRYKLAQLYLWQANYEKAIIEYEEAIEIDPESLEARIDLANSYRWSGDIYSAFDAFEAITTKYPTNPEAKQALEEITGTFFKGLVLEHTSSTDNEDFELAETRIGISGNFSLRSQLKLGFGLLNLQQNDEAENLVGTKGSFMYGIGNYSFDRQTRLQLELKFNFLDLANEDVTTDGYYIELEHKFTNLQEYKDLVTKLFYTSQDAVLEVASKSGLLTWTKALRADKLGIWGRNKLTEKIIVEAQMQYMFISDGNTRSDLWAVGEYRINEPIATGVRLDYIDAKMKLKDESDIDPDDSRRNSYEFEYWTPDAYFSYMAFLKLQKRFSRLNYSAYGAIGRISKTNNAIRQFSLQVEYRISTKLNFGGRYSSLQTNREDGEYKYKNWALSLAWSK